MSDDSIREAVLNWIDEELNCKYGDDGTWEKPHYLISYEEMCRAIDLAIAKAREECENEFVPAIAKHVRAELLGKIEKWLIDEEKLFDVHDDICDVIEEALEFLESLKEEEVLA